MNRIALCILALVIDAVVGDPAWLTHPVVVMGRVITWLERTLRARLPQTPEGERQAGRILVVVMVVGTLAFSYSALQLAGMIHPILRFALEVFWGWQCLAMRGLWQEAANVEEKLQTATITEARAAVGRIVGRDVQRLDRVGVTKAAIESVAESFCDGVVAPMCYLALGGAPLALCYKAINTMDSMVGYKNERYLDFGRAAAHVDDVANWLPSRLAALLLIASAPLCGTDARAAWCIWRRDHANHASPNSAQTESAMAGALGLQLAGPAWYFGTYYDKPTIGDATREPEPTDIGRACRMMCVGSVLCLLVVTSFLGICNAFSLSDQV